MDYLEKIDGMLPLDETRKTCEVVQHGGFRLDCVKFGVELVENETVPVNKAEFVLESILKILNEIKFVEVGNQPPTTIKDGMTKSQGYTFICDSQMYDQGNLKRVMIFGKKT